ncbi:MAG TPA: LPS export ABC transporter ATP-binding protein [Myxococcales bacterium]|jgi:lipopolysaccharide export system ATP-binding protein|nr:LPS export ABC transporter ATP-binding protein [Myxococcales bacterium]
MMALRAHGLRKSFRGRRVVDDVSFAVAPGEVVGLLGPNGAGKTTSFHCVVGLLAPDHGEVRLGERDLSGLPLHERARLGIGYLPQEPSIFRKLTVRQNFLLVLEGMKLSRKQQEDRADKLMTEFDLLRVAGSLGETLSGGERRRAEIARSLLAEPKFMLFDEPFAGVDPIAVHDLQRLIGRLRERGLGVLITDHAVRETLGICDRAVLLAEGKLLESGTPVEIAASERARAVYLGERFKLEQEG